MESLNFSTPQKPGLHHPHCPRHYLPDFHRTTSQTLNAHKLPKFSHNPPQNNMVRCGTAKPHNSGTNFCLRVIILVIKHRDWTKATWEGKDLFDLHLTEGSQDRNSSRAGTWSQELMQRPWRSATYCLAPRASVGLLFYRIQDHRPRCGPTYNGLGPLTSITN